MRVAKRRIPVHERRQALVEAAMRVMERDGIAAATTRAVCAEADMPGSFFHYCFTSKQEFMLEVAQQFRRRFMDMLALADDLSGDLHGMLRAGLATLLSDASSDPQLHQLTYELPLYALRDAELAGTAQLCYLDNERVAADFLRTVADIANSEWTVPVSKLARFVAVAVDGVVLQWLMLRDDERAAEHIETLATYLSGLARPRSHDERGREDAALSRTGGAA
jgi:AcrR family transcriptional regulator